MYTYQLPKSLRMIHFYRVAELVNHQIFHKLGTKEDKGLIEIDILFGRTTSPPCALKSYCASVIGESVLFVDFFEPGQ